MRPLGLKRSRRWIAVRTWLIRVGVRTFIPVYRILPTRLTFGFLTLCEYFDVPGRAALMKPFVGLASWEEGRRPGHLLTPWLARQVPNATAFALFQVEAYRLCAQWVADHSYLALPMRAYEVWVRSLFELGRFDEAIDVLASHPGERTAPHLAHMAGHLELIDGNVGLGVSLLAQAAASNKSLLCPHQNLAARYEAGYIPTPLDRASGSDGLLFDAYNFVGQRVVHVGEGHRGTALYASALAAQDRLRADVRPPLSKKLTALLDRFDIPFPSLRLLPTEWFTQIGHQGMLDMLFRMREIGWWNGDVIFLMPPGLVANRAFQALFDHDGRVVLTTADPDITAELTSLQRWCGLNFNAFRLPSGKVVPWQEAGAEMMVAWDRDKRGYPLADRFDRTFGANTAIAIAVRRWREVHGMKPDDWYVCLHMRDASHYGEVAGTGQTHRNTDAAEYMKAIEYVTSRGGWVIKLGGKRSPKLPAMPRLIDYARGRTRTEMMDLHLIRHARFFIGTTSGLTNVAVSFGVPCALVNCITTDAQLWSDRVRFILKRIKLRDRWVTQRELTSTPWRWRVFGADVLARHGATLVENAADEILACVQEAEAVATGQAAAYLRSIPDADAVLQQWRGSLSMPHFYGAAQPSVAFMLKHRDTLLPRLTPARAAAIPALSELAET